MSLSTILVIQRKSNYRKNIFGTVVFNMVLSSSFEFILLLLCNYFAFIPFILFSTMAALDNAIDGTKNYYNLLKLYMITTIAAFHKEYILGRS